MTEEQARQIAAPDSWPWPMSEDAKRWVETYSEAAPIDPKAWEALKPKHERQFDKQAHEDFLRSL